MLSSQYSQFFSIWRWNFRSCRSLMLFLRQFSDKKKFFLQTKIRTTTLTAQLVDKRSFDQDCVRAECRITFDGVDVEKDLSNDDTSVDENNWTEKCLHSVTTQEFHKSLTPSAYKMPRNTTRQRLVCMPYTEYFRYYIIDTNGGLSPNWCTIL